MGAINHALIDMAKFATSEVLVRSMNLYGFYTTEELIRLMRDKRRIISLMPDTEQFIIEQQSQLQLEREAGLYLESG